MAMKSINPIERKVLVTGADQRQGLAVIRALGLQGAAVIACGAEPRSLGCYSRYSIHRFIYTSPLLNKKQFIADILGIIQQVQPAVIIPSVESTLIALDECRAQFEPYPILAAPQSDVLGYALNKSRTLELACKVGLPTPATVEGHSYEELLEKAARLPFPLAVKPRGHRLYAPTAHGIDFKVRYARTLSELQQILMSIEPHVTQVLVQECVPGVGICVGVMACHGDLLATFSYKRLREQPLTGGVSVLRESIPLDLRLKSHVASLLGAMKWHGVAMVEFKYDPNADRYWLMEVNGRIQASAALCLDAGINFPSMLTNLYLGEKIRVQHEYHIGVRERWLKGDIQALWGYVTGAETEPTMMNPRCPLPSKLRAVLEFVSDFRPGTKYDEFKLWDWKPALLETLGLALMLGALATAGLRRLSCLLLKQNTAFLARWSRPRNVALDGRQSLNWIGSGDVDFEAALRRLRFIRNSQALGFRLKEIAELLDLRVSSTAPCGTVQVKALTKLGQVERQVQDLQRLARALRDLLRSCRAGESMDNCPILSRLVGDRRQQSSSRPLTATAGTAVIPYSRALSRHSLVAQPFRRS
jgi:predicted ATP-grasp superfamily ATP-dependent carboligase